MDERITDVEIIPVEIPRKETFVISLGAINAYEGVLVRISAGDVYGWGEAAPVTYITGENQATVIGVLEGTIKPLVVGKSVWELEPLMDSLDRAIIHNPAAKASVDIALHDLRGKLLGRPAFEILGGSKREVITSITIGIRTIEKTVEKAVELVEMGAKIIKVKTGVNPKEDVEKIAAVRKEVGPNIRLNIDANQGYSVKDAIATLGAMEPYDIDWVEQPVYCKDIRGMAEVRRNVSVPVMADESIFSLEDALEVVRADAADIINIKLMKAGGLYNGAKIASIAEAAGLTCMVGCMLETRIGITAGTQFSCAYDVVRSGDLDGHLDLETDVVTDGMDIVEGMCRVPDGPGLGLDVDMDKLEQTRK